jgi:hypothetical protein
VLGPGDLHAPPALVQEVEQPARPAQVHRVETELVDLARAVLAREERDAPSQLVEQLERIDAAEPRGGRASLRRARRPLAVAPVLVRLDRRAPTAKAAAQLGAELLNRGAQLLELGGVERVRLGPARLAHR